MEYRRSKEFEEAHKDVVASFLIERLGLRVIKYIGKKPDGKQYDKDFVGKKIGEDKWIRIEVKLRSSKYANPTDILIEEESNAEWHKPGWIYTSRADLLAYLWLWKNRVEGYIIDMPRLREWWRQNKHKYQNHILVPNPPENPKYHTKCYPVPIVDLPNELILSAPSIKLSDIFR